MSNKPKTIKESRHLSIPPERRPKKKETTLEEEKYVRHLLGERIKELTTLYKASQILQDETRPPEIVLDELVSILPAGWQYPDITEARIVTGRRQYKTPGFNTTYHRQSAFFFISDEKKGSIEVAYRKKKPAEVEGPFLSEERSLINMLAEMLGNYFTRNRVRAEKKLLEQEIMHQKVQEQKKTTRAVLNAQESERNKIGQELHDNVNQILVGAKLYLGLINNENPASPDFAKQSLSLIDNAIDEIRSLSRKEVTPPKKIGLKAIIQSLVDSTNERNQVKIDFCYATGNLHMRADLKLNIYRIIQEAISNILKHAEAKRVTLIVEAIPQGLRIIIEDDGKGFDPCDTGYKGIGITNMTNRVESYNGNLSIKSNPGKGCKIEITIPQQ